MTPRKYAPLIIGALLLAALLLVPFSRNANPASIGKPDGKSTIPTVPGVLEVHRQSNIHVTVSLPHDQYKQLSALNQEFMMKYPYIQVKLTNEISQDSAYERWTLQSQQRQAADVMLLDSGWVKPFAVRGFLQSLDSMLTGDTLSDQMTGLLDPLKWNGYLWGVPKDVNPYIIAWSSTLLEQLGLKAPPADFQAYQEAAAGLNELDAEISILNWSAGDLKQQLVWLAAFQSEITNMINARPFTADQTAELEWLHTMKNQISTIKIEDIGELNEAFRSNKLLVAIMPWNAYEKLNETIRDDLIVDRNRIDFPWLNGRSYVISSNSQADEEAMLWIQEMTNISNQQQSYTASGLLPAKASLYAINSSLESNQAKIPPAWWKKVLSEKQPEDEIAAPDPLWPERWRKLERKWQLYTQESLQIDEYIESLNSGK
ncbi:ABC-type glycerol-3-phosphate transport system substrate-binding protein [Paenibacillus castaneae]|uniref:ABC transporter substrate-binding protein n=1 Tax=Paenibacillus castaneae TaxID=474957 RepID=UPI00141B2000|nr:extracellular solute-binding protein [Paenibacillus castaneae]NIK75886.1 ABC-type glycerol-3-phosphate transport system substrate-binding protein [Paenibacillus castaneae]